MADAAARMYNDDPKRYRPRYRADMHALRDWLTKRRSSLEQVRAPFEGLWKEIRQYFEPNIGRALVAPDTSRNQASARREDNKIINSEPRLCVSRYAAGMQSGITNKAQPWCSIVTRGVDDETRLDPRVNIWCSRATSEVLSALERGNFYRTSQQVYPHAALLGTSVIMILAGPEPGEIVYKLIDEGDYWISEDRYGEVTTLMRRITMTVEQAAAEFMLAALPIAWQRMMEAGQNEERVEIFNLIIPHNPEDAKLADVGDHLYASIYWTPAYASDYETSGILAIRGYDYKPFACLRQETTLSVYGKGIGETTLPDCKELMRLEEDELRMIANEATPAMTAPAQMKGKPINLFPGGITYYDGVISGSQPVQRLFETREGIDKVDAKIQIVSDRIGRFWYNDLFAMMLNIASNNRAQKTATEVSELSGEKVTLLGPVLTQTDTFLNDVVTATFRLLYIAGFIPDAPSAITNGETEIAIEYTSTIHAEMRAALKMRAINTLIEVTAMLAQAKPDALDKINTDKVISEVCHVYPGAASYIYDDDEVAAIRAQRAQAAAEQQQQQQFVELAKNAGQNAKSLADTRVGNGNALDALMRGSL